MNTACFKCGTSTTSNDIWYGLHKNCFIDWFGLKKVEDFLDIVARSQSQAPIEQLQKNSSFFHGKFRKYSSSLAGVDYILKVQQVEYPELPVMEYVCNKIFVSLKIEVPDFYLIRFGEEDICFVTKNFMSTAGTSTLDHIYHYVKPNTKYDCENLVNIIGENTGRRVDQENFVYLTLADSLIGNNDRHGRNLGFIRSTKGMLLAPFYDNPSQLGVEEHSFLGADLQPRGSIHTKDSSDPTMKDYVLEWKRLGYEEVISRFRKNFCMNSIEEMVKTSFLTEKRQVAFLRLITKRGKELCDH